MARISLVELRKLIREAVEEHLEEGGVDELFGFNLPFAKRGGVGSAQKRSGQMPTFTSSGQAVLDPKDIETLIKEYTLARDGDQTDEALRLADEIVALTKRLQQQKAVQNESVKVRKNR